MKTASIYVCALCVPCENRCRYCLLSWDGKIRGADYARSQSYARRFYTWLQKNRPELGFQFYFGYSMEHPQLVDAVDFMKSIGSAGGDFLQMDGLKFRDFPEITSFLAELQAHGIQSIDLTFYGTREYHDRFAGRKGDFDFMLQMHKAAVELGLDVRISIPVTTENAGQIERLIGIFGNSPIHCFVPHGEGRGASLDDVRLTVPVYECLSSRVRERLNQKRFKPEGQWVLENVWEVPENRALAICLTPENISQFEGMDFADAIAYLEKLDDDYYAAIPPLPELAALYGNPSGEKFYSQRDLYLFWQRRYIREHGLNLYDVNDEWQCFSRRY